jgi:cytochrome c2
MMDVTPQPVDPSSLPEPNSTGAEVLKKKCTQCHGLVSPRQHAAQEWPHIVDRMDRRTQMMAGMMGASYLRTMTAAEKSALVSYLERHSFRAIAPGSVPEKGSPAAQAFVQTCSACHAPPDRATHTPEEWGAVVTRMGQNMEQQGFGPLAPQQKKLILSYLQSRP